MSTTTPTNSEIRDFLMTSVIERVELALSDAHTMNQLLARGFSYSEARKRLIESTYARLAKQASL
jgi:hypothetical protein